jgi:5,6-dimethylbenzimidazole synthase
MAEDPERRAAVRAAFERANRDALAAYEGESAHRYARLKLAGLDAAPIQIAVFADPATGQGCGLGRRTMPETIEYSAALAVHTLWLAARAHGIGVGWVSILDPADMAPIFAVPENWSFIAYLCLGFPESSDDLPALERAGWEQRRQWKSFVLKR